MPSLTYQTTIKAPIDAVWAFHDDVARALPALSPPGDEVTLESMDGPPRVGFTLVINAKGPVGRVRWVARYEAYDPPHNVVFGREARFVDVQDEGPFKQMRHSHEFEAIDDHNTRMIDHIDYQVGYGPLGWVADLLIVRRKFNSMFRYRHAQLRKLLDRA